MPKGYWWVIEAMSFGALLCIPAFVLSSYAELPATIPTHFGLSGTPDGYGDKSTMLFIVIVSGFVFTLMSTAPFHPHLINIPGPRTPEKIQTAIGMLRILKLEVMAFFAYLSWAMIRTALGAANGLGGVVPLVFVSALLLTIGIGLLLAIRNEN